MRGYKVLVVFSLIKTSWIHFISVAWRGYKQLKESTSMHLIARKYSDILGNFRERWEKIVWASDILQRIFKNLPKSSKKSPKSYYLYIVTIYKQNITYSFVDTKFIFSCSPISISHSFAGFARELSSWTLEDKSVKSSIYLYKTNKWTGKWVALLST